LQNAQGLDNKRAESYALGDRKPLYKWTILSKQHLEAALVKKLNHSGQDTAYQWQQQLGLCCINEEILIRLQKLLRAANSLDQVQEKYSIPVQSKYSIFL